MKTITSNEIQLNKSEYNFKIGIVLVCFARSLYKQMCERLLRSDACALGFLLTIHFLLLSNSISAEEFEFLLDLGVELTGDHGPLARPSPKEGDEDDESGALPNPK